jgi:hypothetical protein
VEKRKQKKQVTKKKIENEVALTILTILKTVIFKHRRKQELETKGFKANGYTIKVPPQNIITFQP